MAIVQILASSCANLESVACAFRRLGCAVERVSKSAEIRDRAPLVLPGVGSFRQFREEIDSQELRPTLAQRVGRGAPTLGICLGMHFLTQGSDEDDCSTGGGLGLAETRVGAFDDAAPRSPHMGWNRVVSREPASAEFQFEDDYYFAHSYRVCRPPQGWDCCWSEHGGQFVAGFRRGAVWGLQFHPELSGQAGAECLAKWLQVAQGGRS